MKPDLPVLSAASARPPDRGHEGLGYPSRLMAAFAAALALAVIWLVLPLGPGVAWMLTVIVGLVALALIGWCTYRLSRAREQSAHVLTALGAATADIPANLRTRMPLVLVTGDGLPALFDRIGETRHAHVGDGGIWLRVDRPQDLPRLAVAVRQWRDGRAPDGVVLSIAPALHTGTDVLVQKLRVIRQAVADAARMLGTRLPGYVAVYQRLATGPVGFATPEWYGVSSAAHLMDADRFEPVIRAAEDAVQRAMGDRAAASRAAALASIIGWTQRVVLGALADRQLPATPWALFGAGWIDCGPATGPNGPWERDVELQTRVRRSTSAASPTPWPLPQPLIEAMPRRYWLSPRVAAAAHALALLACAAAAAFWGAARNNEALLTRMGADLGRYSMIPADHGAAKRDALQVLVADRDQLDRYARNGIPLRLSFGMYRGAQLMPALNDAIASYVPPPPPPAVVTLDSMSLFDSGRAQLKPGSNRAMVGALDMIKSHPDKRILVAGYTDNMGNPESNLKLSTARAEAVRDWLVDASGIPATQFAIQGYGMTRPIASNDTPDGRARNRRVEITLVPDLPAREGQGKQKSSL
ncbi:flagellar motor protein MotB [Burkholderia ubonensis]|uniref:OmpA family protein n=1 Tax=Burkholderia ubonensis TaxID=101571 RepID=UPI00075AA42C|nr:OmpA family protein [Burkholderia ubonensis]KVH73728.1 flagellar motor protein MotB [Burkholderia ubonensis]KVT95709.1 flagellar motor protein MotB [Burkholderia ubonensis]